MERLGGCLIDQVSGFYFVMMDIVIGHTVVKELRSKMFGQHPGYFKEVFLKQTRIIMVSTCIYKYTVYIMF